MLINVYYGLINYLVLLYGYINNILKCIIFGSVSNKLCGPSSKLYVVWLLKLKVSSMHSKGVNLIVLVSGEKCLTSPIMKKRKKRKYRIFSKGDIRDDFFMHITDVTLQLHAEENQSILDVLKLVVLCSIIVTM